MIPAFFRWRGEKRDEQGQRVWGSYEPPPWAGLLWGFLHQPGDVLPDGTLWKRPRGRPPKPPRTPKRIGRPRKWPEEDLERLALYAAYLKAQPKLPVERTDLEVAKLIQRRHPHHRRDVRRGLRLIKEDPGLNAQYERHLADFRDVRAEFSREFRSEK